MGFIADLVERIRSLVTRDREAREHAEEIRYHIELEIRKNVAAGMDPREARRAAHRAFGGVEHWTEAWREARGIGPVERGLRDLRLAIRRLAREPGLTVPSLFTLAFGVCATTVVFALTYAILLRPLPYPDADRLVEVGHTTPTTGEAPVGQSFGTYAYYREGNRSFSDVALYDENDVSVSVTDGDAPEHVRVAMVTPSFFPVLGIPPEAGRWFNDDDVARGPADPRTPVVISHNLWVRRYGADPSVVDGTIELNLTTRRVVGVMPAGFAFPHARTDVW